MLVSGRHAARILLTRGGMTGEAQARALLRAGAAGPGTITDRGVFFDRDRVRSLADRQSVDPQAQESCPAGIYLARLPRTTSLDLTRPWSEVTRQVDRVPRMPTMTVALLQVTITAAGRLPWLATFHGFVVHGADVTGFATDDDGVRRFALEPPGAWFAGWQGRRVPTGPGGRPWVIRRPRVS